MSNMYNPFNPYQSSPHRTERAEKEVNVVPRFKALGTENVLIHWHELEGGMAIIGVEGSVGGVPGLLGKMVLRIPVGYLPVSAADIEMLALSVAKPYLTDAASGIAPGYISKLSSVNVRAAEGLGDDSPSEWTFEYSVDLESTDPQCMSYGWEMDSRGWSTLKGVRW